MKNETKFGNTTSIVLIVAGTIVALGWPIQWFAGVALISTGILGRIFPAEQASLSQTFQNGKDLLFAHSLKSSSTPIKWYQPPVIWGLAIIGLVLVYELTT